MSAALGLAGLVGGPVGGAAADVLAQRDPRWRAWFCAGMTLLAWSGASLSLIASSAPVAIACLLLWGLCANSIYGTQMAVFHSVIAEPSRGLATSLYYFVGQLIGAGGGATLAGVLSDRMTGAFGGGSLRAALLVMTCFMLWAAVHWLLAARSLQADARRLRPSLAATESSR
jgi:MFS family permease